MIRENAHVFVVLGQIYAFGIVLKAYTLYVDKFSKPVRSYMGISPSRRETGFNDFIHYVFNDFGLMWFFLFINVAQIYILYRLLRANHTEEDISDTTLNVVLIFTIIVAILNTLIWFGFNMNLNWT